MVTKIKEKNWFKRRWKLTSLLIFISFLILWMILTIYINNNLNYFYENESLNPLGEVSSDQKSGMDNTEEQTISKNSYIVSEPKIWSCPRTDGYGNELVCSSVQIKSEKGFYEFMNFLYLFDDNTKEYYNRVPVGGGSTSKIYEGGVGASFYLDCSIEDCTSKELYLIYVASEGTSATSKDINELKEKDYTYVFEVELNK